MKKIKLLITAVSLLFIINTSIAQIKNVNLEYRTITNELDLTGNYHVFFTNTADSIVVFDWSIIVPEELKEYFSISIADRNIDYNYGILTSCGKNKPNEVLPQDTFSIHVIMRLDNEIVPENLFPLIDSIYLNLTTFPDCTEQLASVQMFYDVVVNTTEEIETEQLLYPNPVEHTLNLSGDPLKPSTDYTVYDLNGCLLLSGKMENNQINTRALVAGFYILEYGDGDKRKRLQFVKS